MPRTAPETRLCRLEQVLGREVACAEAGCPFWEPGGAVLDGRCAFDSLALGREVELAKWLLQIRAGLEVACTRGEEEEIRHHLHRLLNRGGDE